MGLSPELLRAVEDAGYTEPTPIQKKAIPIVLQGRDVMGCAQTGTGKTASFALPMIDILASGRARVRMPRALILEPTRELAAQVAEAFDVYGKNHKLEIALLIGGVSMVEQNKKLDRGADILIATPGRLLDHTDRGQVMLRGVKILVIDETDRMLDMGFIPDVQRIVKLLPPLRQTLFFSATLDSEIRTIGTDFVSNPKEVSVSPPSSPAATVRQGLIRTTPRNKLNALLKLIQQEKIEHAIIFLNRKRDVDPVVRSLNQHNYAAAPIHGDLAQSVRTTTLENFKDGEVKILVASDVAARGLDIQALPFVVNYDVPNSAEDYIHRIGRTARAGREGSALTLATGEDSKLLSSITALLGKPIPEITLDGDIAPGPELDTLAEKEESPRTSRGRGRRKSARSSSSAPAKTAATRKSSRRKRAPMRKSPAQDSATKKKAAKPAAANAKTAAKKNDDTIPKKAVAEPSSKSSPRKQATKKQESVPGGVMEGHVPAFLLRPVPQKLR